MKNFKIGDLSIGEGEPCFVVAEMGLNHNGSVATLLDMVKAASESGVDAVKFQMYETDEFMKMDNKDYDMFRSFEINKYEWKCVVDYCEENKILYFFTPQNISDLEKIKGLCEPKAIKIGSDDLTNLELIEYVSRHNCPVILSAGMAEQKEIQEAVRTARRSGCSELAVLHCVSLYPAYSTELNLRKMQTIEKVYDVVTGFSDHSPGTMASTIAVAMGAHIIEKHFTLDKKQKGGDHSFSADAAEMSLTVRLIERIEQMMGVGTLEPVQREYAMRKRARRVKNSEGVYLRETI